MPIDKDNIGDSEQETVRREINDRLEPIWKEIVSELAGHDQWPGDVEPSTCMRLDQALEDVASQLLTNASEHLLGRALAIISDHPDLELRNPHTSHVGGGVVVVQLDGPDGSRVWVSDSEGDQGGEFLVGFYKDAEDEGTMNTCHAAQLGNMIETALATENAPKPLDAIRGQLVEAGMAEAVARRLSPCVALAVYEAEGDAAEDR